MRDPLDPQNPYAGKYAAYDVWVYVYAWQQAQGQSVPAEPEGRGAGMWYSLPVDENGWPVPQQLDAEQQYQPRQLTDEEAGGCRRAISAYGYMGRTLEELQQRDLLAVRAKHLPPIPQWLAADPPLQACFMPDGEVVIAGELGSAAAGAPSTGGQLFCRLSAKGQELGRVQDTAYWWELYWPGFAALEAKHHSDYWNESMGFVTRYHDGELLETYTYRGEKVRGTPGLPAEGCFQWLSGDSLRELYQQQTGDSRFSSATRSI